MKIFASFKNNIILYLFLVLVFLAACGNNVIKEENSTKKMKDIPAKVESDSPGSSDELF